MYRIGWFAHARVLLAKPLPFELARPGRGVSLLGLSLNKRTRQKCFLLEVPMHHCVCLDLVQLLPLCSSVGSSWLCVFRGCICTIALSPAISSRAQRGIVYHILWTSHLLQSSCPIYPFKISENTRGQGTEHSHQHKGPSCCLL